MGSLGTNECCCQILKDDAEDLTSHIKDISVSLVDYRRWIEITVEPGSVTHLASIVIIDSFHWYLGDLSVSWICESHRLDTFHYLTFTV